LPAGFVLEALAQGCGALVAALSGGEATPGYLAAVDDFRMHGDGRWGRRAPRRGRGAAELLAARC